MSSPLNLTEAEIHEITGKKQHQAQIKALRSLGLTVKARPDGKPLVARDNYIMVMNPERKHYNSPEPNFAALDAAQKTH